MMTSSFWFVLSSCVLLLMQRGRPRGVLVVGVLTRRLRSRCDGGISWQELRSQSLLRALRLDPNGLAGATCRDKCEMVISDSFLSDISVIEKKPLAIVSATEFAEISAVDLLRKQIVKNNNVAYPYDKSQVSLSPDRRHDGDE